MTVDIERNFNLLSADEPPPFDIINAQGRTPCLLVFDHAGSRYPKKLDFLGLNEEERYRHFAIDIGIEHMAEPLSRVLDAPMIRANYSRAVIDLNRGFHEPSCIPEQGEGLIIPGNQNLSAFERAVRFSAIYAPFEKAMSDLMDTMQDVHGDDPVFVFCVHSYTPEFHGQPRPWDIAVLWDYDSAFAQSIIDHFKEQELNVGENEPYDARKYNYTTPDRHVMPRKVYNGSTKKNVVSAIIEVRNDLIATPEQGKKMAENIGLAVTQAIKDYKDALLANTPVTNIPPDNGPSAPGA